MFNSNIKYVLSSTHIISDTDNIATVDNSISNINDLFKLISNNQYDRTILILDIEYFGSLERTDIVSFIDSIHTIITCTCCDITSRPKIVVAVDYNSDPCIIKILSGTKIDGFYPRGCEFTQSDKLYCLNKITNNEFYIHPSIKQLLNNKKSISTNTVHLTPRQEQIVSLIRCRGASNKVIAKMLNITESTVKLHLSHVFKKCGVKNRTQLVVFLKK